MNIKKLTTMAMLTAISMIVFLIEAQIPIPIAIPGVKLGVANVITLFALWTLGWRGRSWSSASSWATSL